MLHLQLHEDYEQIRRWEKGGHLPHSETVASIKFKADYNEHNRLLSLNDTDTNLPLAFIVDECEGLRHTLFFVVYSKDLAGQLNLDMFKAYSKERCYLEAVLLVPAPLVEGVKGRIRHRSWYPKNPQIGIPYHRLDLIANGLWESKIELLKGHRDLEKMSIRTVGFDKKTHTLVSNSLKKLGFQRLTTAFVI